MGQYIITMFNQGMQNITLINQGLFKKTINLLWQEVNCSGNIITHRYIVDQVTKHSWSSALITKQHRNQHLNTFDQKKEANNSPTIKHGRTTQECTDCSR